MSIMEPTARIAPEVHWDLTEAAREQIAESGIALSELYRLLKNPAMRMPGNTSGYERLNGYGLSVLVQGTRIVSVEIDGATRDNWKEWARERAEFGDGDVEQADAMVREDARAWQRQQSWVPRQKKRKKHETVAGPVRVQHVLDKVHPALRAEITRHVKGDFSRLIVHSPTNVTINPA